MCQGGVAYFDSSVDNTVTSGQTQLCLGLVYLGLLRFYLGFTYVYLGFGHCNLV